MEAGLPSGRSLLSDPITPPVHTTVLPDSSRERTLPGPAQAGEHAGKGVAPWHCAVQLHNAPKPSVPFLTPPKPLAA